MPGRVIAPQLFALGRDPSPIEAEHGSRLPGIGARFVAGVLAEACTEGWGQGELAGLVAATEERSALWLVTPGPGRRVPEIRRWQSARFVRSEQDLRSLVLTASAVREHNVCLVGISGRSRRADAIAAQLTSVGARVGRVEFGVADALELDWAVELMIAPRLPRGLLGSLREVMASAPRCGWCGMPVLGNRCRRCTGDA